MATPTDVSIDVSATDGDAPFAIALTPRATDTDGDPLLTVDFGDGSVIDASADVAVAHVYTSPGQYTITMTAESATPGGDTVTAEPVLVTVLVPNTHPLIDNDGGVCEPWITVNDLCATVDGTKDETLAIAAVNEAVRWLNDATGNAWMGPCTAFLRPNVGDTSICDPLTTSRRGRRPIDLTLWLEPPVLSIVELRVDGEVIAPKWYYLADGKLHASSGWDDDDSPLIPWPEQNERRQAGAPGTWDVTVRHGSPPPESLVGAARTLACELYKSCTGDESCELPKNAASVSRDGVTITFQPPVRGRTGIPRVDAQIDLYGPDGLGRPARRMLDPADPTTAQVHRY